MSELSQTLAIAFKQRQKPQVAKTKYDYLIADAVLSAGEFELAARQARKKAIDIEQVLTDEFQVKIPAIGAALSKFFGVPYEAFKSDRVKPADLLKNLKREYVESNQWVPIDEGKEGLVVLCLDPERIRSSRIASNVFPKARILYKVATQKDFKETVNQFYGAETGPAGGDLGNVEDLLGAMGDDPGEVLEGSTDEVSAAADNELVKLVNKVIVDAYNQGASDIHIEPYPGQGEDRDPLPQGRLARALHRDPGELPRGDRRAPQDHVRPGHLGEEKAAGRQDQVQEVRPARHRAARRHHPDRGRRRGHRDADSRRRRADSAREDGLHRAQPGAGARPRCPSPTACSSSVARPAPGKTTTLHSVLKFLNTPDTKIWTAEDPVEITQKGLRQVQVNKKAGLDFAVIMKAFLRADPDIIMVGEMRDKETTGTGIEASLTGHLVFATLHTNSAPESITRLLDMGMDPFNFSDALLGILAQRLAKRMCSCKQPYTPDGAELTAFLREYCDELMATSRFKADPKGAMEAVYKDWIKAYGNDKGQLTFYKTVGCDKCGGSGFKGRCGLHELLIASDRLKKAIQEHARVAEMLAICLEEGMRTLKQDGMEKCLMGVTHMKEVRAVCVK